MITTASYENYSRFNIEPAWYKAEHYDYCDSYFDDIKRNPTTLDKIIKMIFHK